jgi:hypothetical protein
MPGVADLAKIIDCAGDIAVGKSTSGVLSLRSIGSVFYASMSAFGGKGENMCSHRAFPVLTPSRTLAPARKRRESFIWKAAILCDYARFLPLARCALIGNFSPSPVT